MGRTNEALFEKLVEVALKDELDVSLYALIDPASRYRLIVFLLMSRL